MQYTHIALFHTVASCNYCTFSTGTYVIYIFGEKHFVCLMPIKHFVLYCIVYEPISKRYIYKKFKFYNPRRVF